MVNVNTLEELYNREMNMDGFSTQIQGYDFLKNIVQGKLLNMLWKLVLMAIFF